MTRRQKIYEKPTKRISVSFPSSVYKRIEKEAKQERVTKSLVVAECVEKILGREIEKRRLTSTEEGKLKEFLQKIDNTTEPELKVDRFIRLRDYLMSLGDGLWYENIALREEMVEWAKESMPKEVYLQFDELTQHMFIAGKWDIIERKGKEWFEPIFEHLKSRAKDSSLEIEDRRNALDTLEMAKDEGGSLHDDILDFFWELGLNMKEERQEDRGRLKLERYLGDRRTDPEKAEIYKRICEELEGRNKVDQATRKWLLSMLPSLRKRLYPHGNLDDQLLPEELSGFPSPDS